MPILLCCDPFQIIKAVILLIPINMINNRVCIRIPYESLSKQPMQFSIVTPLLFIQSHYDITITIYMLLYEPISEKYISIKVNKMLWKFIEMYKYDDCINIGTF